jgi:RNA polymerase sigma-70 factor (ECF subfamily)
MPKRFAMVQHVGAAYRVTGFNMTKEEFYEIVERAKAGDAAAFQTLIESKLKSILLQAMNILHNQQDAEDATQEIVLSVYNNISKLRDPHVFNAWLNRIIVNTCNTNLSKKIRRNESLGTEEFYVSIIDEDLDFLPDEHLAGKEHREKIRHIINDLPERRRDAIRMYYFDEMTYVEIARIMNVTVSSVSAYIVKAKKQIKKKYDKTVRHP